MPLSLKPWELRNIEYHLIQYLRNKLLDTHIDLVDSLKETKGKYVMVFKCAKPITRKKPCYMYLGNKDDILITLKIINEVTCEMSISTKDFAKLHDHINQKIITLMNLYFTGECIQKWELHAGPLTNAPKNYPHAETRELRLFQVPKIAHDETKLQKFKETFFRISKEILPPNSSQTTKLSIANPILGGLVGQSSIKGKGIYLFYSEYSLAKLLAYHYSRFRDLECVEYWIKDAIKNSKYWSQALDKDTPQYNIIQKLDTQDNIKYTMVISIENVKLPERLLINLDKWQMLIKVRLLGSIEKFNHYKLTLNAETVLFLNAYYFKRICDSLSTELRPEIKENTKWLFYQEEGKVLVSKVCLALFPEFAETKLLTIADIFSLWKNLTGQDYAGNDTLPAKCDISGVVEIIKINGEIIGILFTTSELDKFLKNYEAFHLFLPPTQGSLPEQGENLPITYARGYNGEDLANKIHRLFGKKNKAPQNNEIRHAQFSDLATQSPPSFSILDEKDTPISPDKFQDIFPKSLSTAQLLQFFSKPKVTEPPVATPIAVPPPAPIAAQDKKRKLIEPEDKLDNTKVAREEPQADTEYPPVEPAQHASVPY